MRFSKWRLQLCSERAARLAPRKATTEDRLTIGNCLSGDGLLMEPTTANQNVWRCGKEKPTAGVEWILWRLIVRQFPAYRRHQPVVARGRLTVGSHSVVATCLPTQAPSFYSARVDNLFDDINPLTCSCSQIYPRLKYHRIYYNI